MFDALTTDVVLAAATVGVCALAVGGTLTALRATRVKKERIDVEPMVETAPYQRLDSAIQTDRA